MHALTDHLVELGHRGVGVLTFRLRPDGRSGPATTDRIASADFRVTRERLTGVFDAFEAAGLDRAAVDVYEVATNTQQAGHDAALAMLTGPHPPTALVCLADQLALGALAPSTPLDSAPRLTSRSPASTTSPPLQPPASPPFDSQPLRKLDAPAATSPKPPPTATHRLPRPPST